jgi:hypothetical protein
MAVLSRTTIYQSDCKNYQTELDENKCLQKDEKNHYKVVAECYPPFLGVTKEMISQGPQVADMEYRETYQQAEPHITPLITMRSMAAPFTTPAWLTEDGRSCSMR